jgi:hypothetical protein
MEKKEKEKKRTKTLVITFFLTRLLSLYERGVKLVLYCRV